MGVPVIHHRGERGLPGLHECGRKEVDGTEREHLSAGLADHHQLESPERLLALPLRHSAHGLTCRHDVASLESGDDVVERDRWGGFVADVQLDVTGIWLLADVNHPTRDRRQYRGTDLQHVEHQRGLDLALVILAEDVHGRTVSRRPHTLVDRPLPDVSREVERQRLDRELRREFGGH